MTSLVVLAILAGCAALLYLKGTLARGVIMVLNAILAGFFALAYFELVGGTLGKYVSAVAAWAPMIGFLLVFILVFAVLQTIAIQTGKEKINFGLWPERIGRVVCGLILGYVVAGQLLVAGALAPLPNNYPYPRFSDRNPNPSQPTTALFNPDGFVVGLFGTISKGSFSALGDPKSFAMVHAGFLNKLYLNRLLIDRDVPLTTSSSAISVPRQGGVREAPGSLRDTEGNSLPSRAGETLTLVTVEILKRALPDAGKFTLSQVRLICRPRGNSSHRLAGTGHTVYPVGYLDSRGRLVQEPLNAQITIEAKEIPGNTKSMDFAFYVPTQLTPNLIGFKANNLEQLSLDPAEAPLPPSGPRETAEPVPDTE